MRRAAFEADHARQRAFRRAREFRFRRLADQHELRSEIGKLAIRCLRADRIRLFTDNEEECEVANVAIAESDARGDHRRDHAFRITSAAAVEIRRIFARCEPGRNGIDVRVDDDARPPARRSIQVKTRISDAVALDLEAESSERGLEKLADRFLLLGR